jgi:hypothetical protein
LEQLFLYATAQISAGLFFAAEQPFRRVRTTLVCTKPATLIEEKNAAFSEE